MASKTANQSNVTSTKNAAGGAAATGVQFSAPLDDRHLANFPHTGERIIHRSANCIIVADPKKGKDVDHDKRKKGAVKEFTNVLPVIVGLKNKLEHTSEMKPETQGMIQAAQRSQNPMFNGAKPERAMRMLKHDLGAQDGDGEQDDYIGNNKQRSKKADLASKSAQPVFRKRGQQKIDFANDRIDIVEDGDPTSIMVRMRMIEEQFLANPLLHEQAAANRKQKETLKGEDSEEGDEGKGDFENFNNQRLLTPRMRKLMNNKDAREVLQEEINESVLRLKQAKFGHSLQEIVPNHENSYYLPDKSKYIPQSQKRGSNSSVLSIGSQPSLGQRKSQLGQRGGNVARNVMNRSNTNMSRASVHGAQPAQQRRQVDQIRAYSSANETASMFLTEPPSAFAAAQATPVQAQGAFGVPHGVTPINLQQSSVRKQGVNANMNSVMRQTGFSTAAGETLGPSHLSGLGNSTLSQYNSNIQAAVNAGQSSALKSIIGAYQIGPSGGCGSSFGQQSMMRRSAFGTSVFPDARGPSFNHNEEFYKRMGSTLTSVGTQMVNRAMGMQRMNQTGRNSYRSAGPTPALHDPYANSTAARSQVGGSIAAVHQNAPPGKVQNFREAWKKAIEKFSPKRPMRLNDVSFRFQMKLEEANAVNAKREGRDLKKEEGAVSRPFALSVPPNLEDDQKINFISMIDQKPIKPSYLDLIPFKNFAKKESDAMRTKAKDTKKQQDSNEPRSDINKSIRQLENVKQAVAEAMASKMKKEEMLKEAKDKDLQRQIKTALKTAQEAAAEMLTPEQIEEIKRGPYEEMFYIEVPDLDVPSNPNEPTRTKKIEAPSLRLRNQLKALALRKLSPEQEGLLRKLLNFEETMWKYDSESLGHALYELFFDWREAHPEKSKQRILSQHAQGLGDAKDVAGDKDDGAGSQQLDPEAEKTEKKKMAMFKMSQEMQEFLDNGGFPKVLNDIFNPTDQASMELDSVFQLKQLCKAFYEKKHNLSKQLVQCLDALANERPWAVAMKKKHFDTQSNNLLTDMEYMRINAERERIRKYQNITKESAYKYYKILKQLSQYKTGTAKNDAVASSQVENQDPQYKIKAAIKEAKINSLIAYITDFMKQVIEHGNDFSHSHFFMLLMNLTPEEVSEPMIVQTIKIIKDELGVTELEYVEFTQGLKDAAQQKAYFELLSMLYSKAATDSNKKTTAYSPTSPTKK